MGLLDGLLGSGQAKPAHMSPMTMAVVGALAYHALKGRGLGDLVGRGTQASPQNSGPGTAATGGLSSMLPAGALAGGLADLVQKLRLSGLGDKADSWVSTGPNKPIQEDQMEKVLGEDRLQWLQQQTGLSRDELLAGLSRSLPEAVDKLTPNGRLPTEQETQRLM